MRRRFRLLWIAITNGLYCYFALATVQTEWQLRKLLATSDHSFRFWPEAVSTFRNHPSPFVQTVTLLAGILLEIRSSRAAKYVNLGVYSVLCLFWCIALLSLIGNKDAETHAVVLGYGLPFGGSSFVILISDYLLYREWRNRHSTVEQPS